MTIKKLRNSYWSVDDTHPLYEGTLGELLREAARECPNRTALVDGVDAIENRRRWTYQELLQAAEQIARALLTRFEKGDRIAVYMPNCAEWILLQHGIHLAGLVLVPVNPAYNLAELSKILHSAQTAGLFYVDEFRGRNLVQELCNVMADHPSLKSVYSLSQWDQFIAQGDNHLPLPHINNHDLLQIQFTSGTTGTPKGACLHHKGTINTARFVAERAGFKEGGVWVNAMPMFHVGGSIVTGLGTLSMRGTYVVAPGFVPENLLNLIETEQGNITLIVPTMILALINSPLYDQTDFSSLNTILSGAAEVPATLVERAKEAFGCDLSILFGQTELHGVVCQTSIHDSAHDQSNTLGQPLPQCEVCIADPDTGQILPIGQTGEILVRGYQTMTGYYQCDAANEETISEDGWLHTGDLATMDERGYLSITGRIKDMLIRGGMNIYPQEIETTLFNHPDVAQVSVIGIEDEKWGEVVAAVIILKGERSDNVVNKLFNYCREHMAPHKAPEKWYFVETFPLTPSGKVQKFVLRDWVASGKLIEEQWQRPKYRTA